MTLEEYIQNTLVNIESIKDLIGNNVYAFISKTNPDKCFIRWSLINEEAAINNVSNFNSLKKAEVQISIFANTIFNARFIANEIEKTFNNNNTSSNIRCSRTLTLAPVVEDKHTIHYPLRLTFFYNQ